LQNCLVSKTGKRKIAGIEVLIRGQQWLHLLIPVRVGTGSEKNCGFL